MRVTVIKIEQKAALVEYTENGSLKRVVIPVDQVINGDVNDGVLSAGITYGEPWEELIDPKTTAIEIATELRKHGVWTLQDARTKPQKVIAALQAAYKVDLSAIVTLIGKEHQNV